MLSCLGSPWFSGKKGYCFLAVPRKALSVPFHGSTLSMSSFAESFPCVSQVSGHSSITSLARLCTPAAECLALQGENGRGQRQATAFRLRPGPSNSLEQLESKVKAITWLFHSEVYLNKCHRHTVFSVILHFHNLTSQQFKSPI